MARIRGSTVIGAVLVAIGMVGIGVQIAKGNLRQEDITGNYDETRTFASSAVKSIHLDVDAGKIHIFRGNTSDIKVHVYGDVTKRGGDQDLKFAAALKGSNLQVEVKRAWLAHWIFSWPYLSRQHDLQVDVEIPDANLETIQVSSSAGQLNMEDVTAGLVSTDLDAGDTNLSDIHGRVVARSDAGEIRIANVSGAMDLRTDAGKISVNQYAILEDITAQTDAGDVDVKVKTAPEHLQFRLNTDAGSASVHLPNATLTRDEQSDVEGSVGTGGPHVNLRSNLGQVSLDVDYGA